MSTDKDTIKSYDNYAEEWAKRMRSGENIAHEYLEKPAMYLKLPDLKGKKVLALGCGTGEECNYLKSLGAEEVVGIDISEGLVKYAQDSYHNMEFRVMDMEKLNFSDNTFDFVYSSLVMHYVSSWSKTLNEVNRVLKSEGTFLFSTHHPTTWGAERTRKDNSRRSSLLGYIKHKDKGTAEVVGDYLNTRKIDDVWFNDFKVSYYHRPLGDIMRDIIQAGFDILDFIEPKATEAVKEKDSMFWEIHEKIPLFMIFELQKKSN